MPSGSKVEYLRMWRQNWRAAVSNIGLETRQIKIKFLIIVNAAARLLHPFILLVGVFITHSNSYMVSVQ